VGLSTVLSISRRRERWALWESEAVTEGTMGVIEVLEVEVTRDRGGTAESLTVCGGGDLSKGCIEVRNRRIVRHRRREGSC